MYIQKKYNLKYAIYALSCICALFICLAFPVYAEEGGKGDGGDGGHHYDTDIYPYSLSFSATQNDTSRPDSNVRITESEFVSSYPIFLYRLDDYADDYFPQSYRVGIYDSETDSVLAVTNSISKNYKSGMLNLKYIQSNYAKKDNEIGNLLSQHDYSGNDYLNESSYFQIYSLGDFTTDAIVFRSQEAALSYYRDGDRGGIFQEPAPDYDYAHDFRSDVYDSDIPVPELSNLSHNGFHVNNADSSRDIEIYITSTFYGLKHNSSLNSNQNHWPADFQGYFSYDSDWVYSTHRFNLINTDISYSDADIDIKEMFKVDNLGALVEDFKSWSTEYPSNKNLPDYSFWQHNTHENNYKLLHNYYTSQGTTDSEKIKLCAQASTTYYVRFCQFVPGSGYTYGKWVSYTYRPSGTYARDSVVIGDVAADPSTGSPSVSNPQSGKQNEDGSFEISDYNSTFGEVSVDNISDTFFGVIRGLWDLMRYYSDFGDFLVATFKFIPYTIWSLIEAGFAISVVILVYKYVRGM